MTQISDDLLCLFNAEIEQRNGSYVVEIPENEVDGGFVQSGRPYRIAVLPALAGGTRGSGGGRDRGGQEAPVEEGDTVEVEIEDIGEQGDGIARIGPGYIVFVPETHIGDRVTVEITKVRDNFAFGDVVEGPY